MNLCEKNYDIDPALYQKYDVKRGLRDINGQGVRAGLTNISNVSATAIVDGESVPARGKLYYRGIDVEQIVKGFSEENRFGFEETVYLLLLGALPNRQALAAFTRLSPAAQERIVGYVQSCDDTWETNRRIRLMLQRLEDGTAAPPEG